MAMRLGGANRAVGRKVVQGVVEPDEETAPAGWLVPGQWEEPANGAARGNGAAPGGAPGPGGPAVQGHSGTVPLALMRAVAATAGFTAQVRYGEAMQALGRALAEDSRTAQPTAPLPPA